MAKARVLAVGGIGVLVLALAAARWDVPGKGIWPFDDDGGGPVLDCRGTVETRLDLPALRACPTLTSETGVADDPDGFWGRIDCAERSRHSLISTDADPHPTSTGSPQVDSSFRRLTVRDGDDVDGERCELGFNNVSGPTALYHEGQRRITFISLRLPGDNDIHDSRWRTVMQMKQAQGYRNPDLSPVIEMQVRDGRWWVGNSWTGVWDAPARQSAWTRFAFDITYSQDPQVGSIKVYVDLNGDGDASDSGEQSPLLHRATLRAETPGSGYSDYDVGESIPDHLRVGLYQDPGYDCSSGCSVDVDNVQVVEAPTTQDSPG